jgi:hypothetical protein
MNNLGNIGPSFVTQTGRPGVIITAVFGSQPPGDLGNKKSFPPL